MKEYLILPFFLFACHVNASVTQSIADAMAIEETEPHTNNSWEDTAKIKGVTWSWPFYESGEHDSTMRGKAKLGNSKNPNIGAVEVLVTGSRTMLGAVEVSVANFDIEPNAFGKGEISRIATSCDEDMVTQKIGFYRLQKSGYKPLFFSYISSWGAGGGGDVYFKLAYTFEDIADLYDNNAPCIAS